MNLEPSNSDRPKPSGETSSPARPAITPESLGLTAEPLPKDPEAALAAAKARDRVDAALDSQVFAVKIRRAVLLENLKAEKVHRHFHKSWEDFVEKNFAGGYDTWSRFRAVARVQCQLRDWEMPLVSTEAHARAIAPRLGDRATQAKLREILEKNEGVFPAAREISAILKPKSKPAANAGNRLQQLLLELASAKGLQPEERTSIQAILERLTAKGSQKKARRSGNDIVTARPDLQASFGFAEK